MVKSVQEIQRAIEQLPEAARRELFAWQEKYYEDEWDRQIEEDARAGRLDHLAEKALRDHAAGRTREL